MPASIEEQIAQRVQAIAAGVPGLAGVYRDRQDAFTREESPALLIELVDADSQPLGGGRGPFVPVHAVDANMVRLACMVCVRGAAWQSTADAARVQLHALIFADATLRSLVLMIQRDRVEWKAASADLPFGYCAQIYAFKTLTRAHALDALAT